LPGTVSYEYSADEREFAEAVDRFKATGRPFPTLKELLDILKQLGWRKKSHAEAQRRGGVDA
jgi:phosphoglycolate phosphatase-like HAD superfamily hydrolase